MSRGELILTIKNLKEKYESEWKSVEDAFMATIEEIRKFVTEKTKKGEKFTKEDAETILNLVRNSPQASRFLLRYIGSVGSDKKHVIMNLLSNENFSKLLDALESEKFEEIKLLAERIVQTVYNVGYATLTTWLAILRPDLFIPLWGYEKENGTVPQSFLRKFDDTKRFIRWWNLEVDELFEFLEILKKIANSVGINNLFELAFYLNKYQERTHKDIATRRFWLIAPGEGAEYWNTCVKREIICVGWRNAIEKYGKRIFELDYDEFKNVMKNEFGYGNFHELWKFLKEISTGDIIFAKKGMKEIIGIGIVESGPAIDLELGDYPIYRKVKWINKNLKLESPKQFRGTVTELTYEEIGRSIELKNLVDNIIRKIISRDSKDELDKETKRRIESLIDYKKQIILYGPPGTGKTWLAQNYIKLKTNDDKKFYDFVTFHPSYSYEEFIEGLKPIPVDSGLKFVVEDGIFKRIALRAMCEALKSTGNDLARIANELLVSLNKIEQGNLNEYGRYIEKKRELWNRILSLSKEEIRELFKNSSEFYLIIDEINRGDIPRIFGELITLLEADKRLGEENQIIVTLLYSKEPFGVPPNLYIIGTMNTADRSIALIDIALRRRFGFIELMPSYKVLINELGIDNVKSEKQAIEKIKNWDENDLNVVKKLAVKVLYAINEKIKEVYDRDHQIGHSYFLKLKKCEDENKAIKTLRYIWFHEIIPLLQEYFYDSPKKLKDVLGNKFVMVDEDKNTYEFKQMEEISDEEFLDALKELAQRGEQSE